MTAALFGRIQRMLRALFIGVVAFGVIASTSVASSVTYHYDSQGRLTGATYDDGTTVTYLFDDNGNRTDTIVTPAADTTPPSVPGNLTASAVSPSQINLTWSASTDNVGVTGYKLERCQGAGCSNFVQIATPTTTSFPDTGRSESTTYVYRVRAYDGAQNHSLGRGRARADLRATPIDSIACKTGTTRIGGDDWSGDYCGRGSHWTTRNCGARIGTYSHGRCWRCRGWGSSTCLGGITRCWWSWLFQRIQLARYLRGRRIS